MKTTLIPIVIVLLLSACNAQGEGDSWVPAWQTTQEQNTEENVRPVYTNQDRNGFCWKTEDCMTGLLCKGGTDDTAGTCQLVCSEDADCGNGFLCRDGKCQKDCAEVGEKCSVRRVCCFFDQDSDRVNDAVCKADQGADGRCAVQSGTSVSASAEATVEVPLE